MKLKKHNTRANITSYQVHEFQVLIEKLFECCRDRLQYQSERFKLPDAELRCLMLFKEEKYLTPKGISQKMNLVKSRITKIIEGMEKRGVIYKLKDPKDSRGYVIWLTPSGKNKLQEINTFHDEIHHEMLSHISSHQRKALLANLNLLKVVMETGKELMV